MTQQYHFLVFIEKNWKQNLKTCLYIHVHKSIMHSSQKAEANVHQQMNE